MIAEASQVAPETNRPTARAVLPYGLLSLSDLDARVRAAPRQFVVQDLIPEGTVSLAVGDSGLGKTPWAYQLGLAVAAGVPFVGHETKQGRVVYVDMENGHEEMSDVTHRLCSHLGLAEPPPDFWILPLEGDISKLDKIIEKEKITLVIIDTLRAFKPGVESKNDEAAKFLGILKALARKHNVAFLLLHHIKKPGQSLYGPPSLENGPVMQWLMEAAGARALVNQTDVRLGFAAPTGKAGDVDLIVKGHMKLRGEIGPFYFARSVDEAGEITGYSRVGTLGLLGDQHHIESFKKLPETFSFKDAKQILGRADDPTNKFLKKCMNLQLIRKIRKGCYQKCEQTSVQSA